MIFWTVESVKSSGGGQTIRLCSTFAASTPGTDLRPVSIDRCREKTKGGQTTERKCKSGAPLKGNPIAGLLTLSTLLEVNNREFRTVRLEWNGVALLNER